MSIPPSDRSHTEIISKKGLSWSFVIRAIFWVTPILVAATLAYFRTQFASHDELDGLASQVKDNIADTRLHVTSLEEFKTRTEIHQTNLTETLQAIIKEQASQRAVLESVKSGQDRIFNRLDTLSDRSSIKQDYSK